MIIQLAVQVAPDGPHVGPHLQDSDGSSQDCDVRTHLYPGQGQAIGTVVEDRDRVRSRAYLIVGTLQDRVPEDDRTA